MSHNLDIAIDQHWHGALSIQQLFWKNSIHSWPQHSCGQIHKWVISTIELPYLIYGWCTIAIKSRLSKSTIGFDDFPSDLNLHLLHRFPSLPHLMTPECTSKTPGLNIFLPLGFLGVLCFAEKCDVGFCLDVSKLGEKKTGLREKKHIWDIWETWNKSSATEIKTIWATLYPPQKMFRVINITINIGNTQQRFFPTNTLRPGPESTRIVSKLRYTAQNKLVIVGL